VKSGEFLGFGMVLESLLRRFVLGVRVCRVSCSKAVCEAASRSCGNMYSEECSDVARSEEVRGDEGCRREDTSWIPGNGSS
jgi:hypothetical protein